MVFNDNDWRYGFKLTTNPTYVSGTLINFPVHIPINSASDTNNFNATHIFTALSGIEGSYPNRKKLAVTTTITGTQTELPVEIAYWNHAEQLASLWTKVPALTSGVPTILNIYYDVAHADNITYVGDTGSIVAQSVWDSHFAAVYHMTQDPSGYVLDSTSNTNSGISSVSIPSTNLQPGLTGKSIYLGTNHSITIPNSTSLQITDNLTLEMTLNMDPLALERYLIGKGSSGGPDYGFYVSSALNFSAFMDNNSSWGPGWMTDFSSWATNTWVKYNTTFCSGTITLSSGTVPITSSFQGAGTISTSNTPFIIGYLPGFVASHSSAAYFDDIRISNVVRSKLWLDTSYYTITNQLLTFAPLKYTTYYFEGYVLERGMPVDTTIYLHNRATGALIASTISQSDTGYYYVETTSSGAHYMVCLDRPVEPVFNDLILGNVYPYHTQVTVS